ncbi:acyl-CoA dehydrogenase [Pseudolabrys taiwanensis]|uniref:Acyl-CoA dehydrogenase n=1 Tax=Pseudolabrys taiwanensis TaxID=331696 RepID=A0A345ZXC0_9HYPH|nr:acyl-CoA dehydrogenase family protein [Pseudolabrys taiwanensis]AXK81567.1 acyl-CoA dehydrogenase [Pseudolabrys taiwanensis]
MSQELAEADAPTRSIADIVARDLRPLVRRIDEEGLYPEAVLRSLGDAGGFARHISRPEGDASGLVSAIEAMADVSASCITTGFCMWCQDALGWYLTQSENPTPRTRYLVAVASGEQLGGTGLSNAMKAFSGIEPLALKGRKVAGGYRVTGRLPFVSNVQDGHLFAAVFALEDEPDRRVMAVFHAGSDAVALARNAHFVALEGSATYTVLIRDAFVSDDDILSHDADRFIPRIRKGFVLLQAGMGIGAARGAAASMRGDGPGRKLAAHLPFGPDEIDARADRLAERIRALASDPQLTDRSAFLDVLKARLDLSWLALEAAQSAVLQAGARGYLVGAEAARRLRETQFVALVTPSVKHILAELSRG